MKSNENDNMTINKKTQYRKFSEMIKRKMDSCGDDWTVQDLVETYLDFGDEELATMHAKSCYDYKTQKQIGKEVEIQKLYRKNKKNSPKPVMVDRTMTASSSAKRVPTLAIPAVPESFRLDPTPMRRRDGSMSGNLEDDVSILGSKDCFRLERLLGENDISNTMTSAKQCTKNNLDRIAEEHIREYLQNKDREICVGVMQNHMTSSITPPSEGHLATQALANLSVNFGVALAQVKSMDPGPHFDAQDQGRLSAATGLGRVLNLLESEKWKQSIQRLPLDQQMAAAAVAGSMVCDYRTGHQMLHRLCTCQWDDPMNALSAQIQAKLHDSLMFSYRRRNYQFPSYRTNNNRNGSSRFRSSRRQDQ